MQDNIEAVAKCIDLRLLAQILADNHTEKLRGRDGVQGMDGRNAKCTCQGCGQQQSRPTSGFIGPTLPGGVVTMQLEQEHKNGYVQSQQLRFLETAVKTLESRLETTLARLQLVETIIADIKASQPPPGYAEK